MHQTMRDEKHSQPQIIDNEDVIEQVDTNPDIEKHPQKLEPVNTAEYRWSFRRVCAVASLCIAYVGSQALLYMVGGTLSYIGPSINSPYTNWLLTANTLAVTSVVPFVGYITDIFGRRYVCIFGTICLVIGSVVQATATSLGSSVTAMAIGGIGAGICELIALAGVAELTPVRWRGTALALVVFSIIPFIPYLIYIEELVQFSTWRWAIGIVAIWNGIGFIGITFFYLPPPRKNYDTSLTKMELIKRIDWGGAFISIVGVTLFLVGLQYGGYQVSWDNAHAVATLVIGIVLILSWPVYEYFVPKYPMVPGAIFKESRAVAVSYVIVFLAGMIFYSVLGFFPIMLENLYTEAPITTGLRGLGYPLAILFGACVGSGLMSYSNGHVRFIFITFTVIMTAFAGGLAAATPYNVNLATAMATLSSVGIGGAIVPPLTVALYTCPDEYIGTTAALSLAARFLGGSVGTAIYFNIYDNKIKTLLPEYVVSATVQAGLTMQEAIQFATALATDPTGATAAQVQGVTPAVLGAGAAAAKLALADSLRGIWYASIAFGACSIIVSFFLPNIRSHMSNRIAVMI